MTKRISDKIIANDLLLNKKNLEQLRENISENEEMIKIKIINLFFEEDKYKYENNVENNWDVEINTENAFVFLIQKFGCVDSSEFDSIRKKFKSHNLELQNIEYKEDKLRLCFSE